jgi:hypothetical protein
VKIFVSSVRRGLEEERDALPGLISAIGHTPVRFEDFTAQPLPSRGDCLAGVATADAYLLILGPNYGYRCPDTGQSPTHDEWVAAQSAGIPRLVYRKQGVTFEAEHMTVAAILRRADRVLLVRETRAEIEVWRPPGGVVEPGELLTEAVVREVNEESGLLVERIGPLGRSPGWGLAPHCSAGPAIRAVIGPSSR